MKHSYLNRRHFLKAVGLSAAALAVPGCKSFLSDLNVERTKGKPNVLFIAIDDLNDWANCLGGYSGKIYTPNLDRLAKRGVLFTNAHCSAPACNPSRTSIMTGIRPSTSGVYYNAHIWRESPVLKDAVTIPQYFMANGYRAVGGGKIFHALEWFDGETDGQNDPNSWGEYFPSKKRAMPHRVLPDKFNKIENQWGHRPLGDNSYLFNWQPLDKPDSAMPDYKVVDWAIKELNKKHNKPFFQAVGIFRPHIPWHVPRKYFDMYPLDDVKLPRVRENDIADTHGHNRTYWHKWVLMNQQWKKAIQGYLASITFADAQLGRLIDALDMSSYADNSIIVLWSDHGFHLGEKENWEKFTLWEESTRVTFMFVVPSVTRAGSVCNRPVSLLDIYPTLIELCSLQKKPELEGISLVPLLKNPNAHSNRAVITTWGCNNHAVRSHRYRYIRYADGFEELYDHRTDPNEFTNLAGRPEFAPMKKKLAVWIPNVNNKFYEGPHPVDPKQLKKRRDIKKKIDWEVTGGIWDIQNGTLIQSTFNSNCRVFAPLPEQTNYVYQLKARKTGGNEGFLILFRVKDYNSFYQWNIGGWGNSKHAVQLHPGGSIIAEKQGSIESNRWYDIKVVVEDSSIKCFLNGQLIHDITDNKVNSGGIGLGTWITKAEFKDIKINSLGEEILYELKF